MENSTGMKLAILGSAIGATFAGTANAAIVSTVPAGFTPITFTAGTVSSYSFDFDGNKANDFTIASTIGGITLSAIGNNNASSFAGMVQSRTDSSSLVIGDVKRQTVPLTFGNDFGTANQVAYTTLVGNGVYDVATGIFGNTASSGTLGYFAGITTMANSDSGTIASFQLTDFGVVSSAVPEPSTWVMMAAGIGGIGAMRRRKTARNSERRAAAC